MANVDNLKGKICFQIYSIKGQNVFDNKKHVNYITFCEYAIKCNV